jgi:FtsP/CotA-like multicopper oxidase with cupredoxin domain
MSPMNMKKELSIARLLVASVMALFLTVAAHASAPGITGTGGTAATFNLEASTAFLNQPDGSAVYAWGYGCSVAPATSQFQPANITNPAPSCPTMQVPGPTMIVTERQTITINLLNNLPTPAGNTSMLFPGLNATAVPYAGTQPTSCTSTTTPAPVGLLTTEVAPGCIVTYVITNPTPGTHAYYSGTQSDLQIDMGLYGAIIVLPAATPTACTTGPIADNLTVEANFHELDFRNAGTNGVVPGAAFDNPKTCYNREYLFQWAEMDSNIHKTALAQVTAIAASGVCAPGGVINPAAQGCSLDVPTEPYHPSYFVINGRSMPDLMDPNFAAEYPHQPYNGDPHIHMGEQMLIRVIGQGRWQHPYHEHANHVRVLARDGNLVLSQSNSNDLAGQLMFDTDTTPGDAFDGIFYFTGRGLNWDPYGHTAADFAKDPLAVLPCTPDANGYNTGYDASGNALSTKSTILASVNYYEWCQDHNKPIEANPFGDVASGGPATLPSPNIFTNGPWYGGTPYLGPDATQRSSSSLRPVGETAGPYGASGGCSSTSATGTQVQTPGAGCTNLQPSNIQANPGNERGWAYMWHSHNEREITTNNVFPGGMLMMLLVDSREFVIDETN